MKIHILFILLRTQNCNIFSIGNGKLISYTPDFLRSFDQQSGSVSTETILFWYLINSSPDNQV